MKVGVRENRIGKEKEDRIGKEERKLERNSCRGKRKQNREGG